MSSNSSAKTFIAGAIGGGIDSIFTMPFDAVKTQMQMNKQMGSSTVGCVRRMLAVDGASGFYKGFTPFCIMAMGKAAVRWATFRFIIDTVDSFGFDRSRNMPLWTAACGSCAGVWEALVWTAPAERLKVLRQVSTLTGKPPESYAVIIRQHGGRGLWVGATPTAMRSGSNAAIRFCIAGQIKDFYRWLSHTPAGQPLPFYATFLAGGTGGAISVVLNNPVDVVKTKLQAGQASGMIACCKDLYRERGLMAFSAGISARVPQIFLSQAIQFAVVDKIMSW